MNILRKRDSIVDWSLWKDKGRKEEIRKEVERIERDWMQMKGSEIVEEKENEQEEWETELNKEILIEEYDRAVKRIKAKSATGLDGVDYKMIKELPTRYRKEILEIFNAFWKRGREEQ